MSTPPKEPKPEDARRGGASALESTYLGVAPTITPEQAAAAGGAPAAGSAIIAAPMISVSDRTKRGAAQPAAAVTPGAAAPAAAVAPVAPPARGTGLQGGWQSAGIPRAPSPEQTIVHGTPGAWPMPPLGTPPAPAPQVVTPPQVVAAPQVMAAPQRVETPWFEQRPAAPPRPATPAQAPRAATQSPNAAGGLHHTALASDYLRGARDAAFGGGAVAPAAQRPPQPAEAGHQTAYSPISTPAAPPPHWQEPPAAPPYTQPPLHQGSAAASAGYAPPPPTMGPPPTAELSSPVPISLHQPQASVQVFYAEPESGHSLRGTQASVAPKELTASFHAPMPPVIQQATPAPAPVAAHAPLAAALMAPVASPVRHAMPQGLAGTMLDRTPSIPGGALPQGTPPPPANPTLRFEQVPAPRSSLAQQATSFGLNIPVDHQATQWGRPAAEGKAKGRPSKSKEKPSQLRMVVLTFFALLSVLAAAFGPELRVWVDSRSNGAQRRPVASVADQATLTNLPSSGASRSAPTATGSATAAAPSAVAAAAPAATAIPAAMPTSTAPATAAPTANVDNVTPGSTAAGTAAAAAAPTVETAPVAAPPDDEATTTKGKHGRKDRNARTAGEADAPTAAESRLAAEAGKHVIAARYTDALPLYRELQRDYPQNTAYAAMVKVLEQKVAGAKQEGTQP